MEYYRDPSDRLIVFSDGALAAVDEAAMPQWFRELREKEDMLTELLDVPYYPTALRSQGWRRLSSWHPAWPPACQCGDCTGMPYTIDWQRTPGDILYADFSDAHNPHYRLAVAAADFPAFAARFHQLDADRLDELTAATEQTLTRGNIDL
jgi:hypothetical protein